MSLPATNKQWIFKEFPKGPLEDKTFALEENPMPDIANLPAKHVLVKVLTLGMEPSMRGSITPGKSYRATHPIGKPMWAYGIGVVVGSSSSKYEIGTKVTGLLDMSEYSLVADNFVQPYNEQIGIEHISALGAPGRAAHTGLFYNVGLKKGDIVLVSAAAGATGSLVVQIAKVVGAAKIIGIASKAKCQSVVANGADICVDYTSPTFEKDLLEATKEEVTLFFDNAGGPILDAALPCMASHGRVSVCGMISQYDVKRDEIYRLKNTALILKSVLTVKGFICTTDHTPQEDFIKAGQDLAQWVKEGKIKTEIYDFPQPGVEHCIDALKGQLTGQNRGKMVIRIASE